MSDERTKEFWALQQYALALNEIFEKYNVVIPPEAQLEIYKAKKDTECMLNIHYGKY